MSLLCVAPHPQQHAPSPAPLPPPTAEELAAAFPDLHGMRMQDHMDDDPVLATLQFDRLEWQNAREASGLGWELQGWVGDPENRVWLRSEGERRDGTTEHGDIELLWGRPTGPRHSSRLQPRPDARLARLRRAGPDAVQVRSGRDRPPGWRCTLRRARRGRIRTAAHNRLILQPRLEANLFGKDGAARGISSGLSDAALGLRLRYEFHRQFAPYVGYEWSRKFGRTAELAEDAGEARSDRMWVAGIRFWF